MACDLQMTVGLMTKVKTKTKIFKIPAHERHFNEDFLIGFAGTASDIIDIVDFYMNPDLYDRMPRTKGLSGLILTASKKIFVFDTPGKWLAVDQPYHAIGSGNNAALGALSVGATPKEAVLAASKIDPYTGMGLRYFRSDKRKAPRICVQGAFFISGIHSVPSVCV